MKARRAADGGEAPVRRDFGFVVRCLPPESPVPRDGFGLERADASASRAETATASARGDDGWSLEDDDEPFWARLFRAR